MVDGSTISPELSWGVESSVTKTELVGEVVGLDSSNGETAGPLACVGGLRFRSSSFDGDSSAGEEVRFAESGLAFSAGMFQATRRPMIRSNADARHILSRFRGFYTI